jgi:hypothetical protein
MGAYACGGYPCHFPFYGLIAGRRMWVCADLVAATVQCVSKPVGYHHMSTGRFAHRWHCCRVGLEWVWAARDLCACVGIKARSHQLGSTQWFVHRTVQMLARNHYSAMPKLSVASGIVQYWPPSTGANELLCKHSHSGCCVCKPCVYTVLRPFVWRPVNPTACA